MSLLPGNPARGSTSGRPLMVLLDLLGQKWTLRILWELKKGQPCTFRTLRAACDDVSPTLLNKRLKNLRELALIEHQNKGYGLTQMGEELTAEFAKLDSWANAWAESLEELDPRE